MNVNTKNLASITEANQNLFHDARMVDEYVTAVCLVGVVL